MGAQGQQFRERRRSERVLIRIPIKVIGTDPVGREVDTDAEAVVVSRHGALIRINAELVPNSHIRITNSFTRKEELFRVVWVGERKAESGFDVGVELLNPSDVFWGIIFPPTIEAKTPTT
jgi:hypothetical protein